MFAYIVGKLAHKEPSFAIIEANGVGYEIRISLQTYGVLPMIEERCKLFTFFNVREDAHLLYGFSELREKYLFQHLTSVSGIGPATALIMLSSLSTDEINSAIVNEDIKSIQSIKGIGSKTAQRIILELKDRIQKENLLTSSPIVVDKSSNMKRAEALAALITLGIARPVAEKSLDAIIKKEGSDISIEQMIKLALR